MDFVLLYFILAYQAVALPLQCVALFSALVFDVGFQVRKSALSRREVQAVKQLVHKSVEFLVKSVLILERHMPRVVPLLDGIAHGLFRIFVVWGFEQCVQSFDERFLLVEIVDFCRML